MKKITWVVLSVCLSVGGGVAPVAPKAIAQEMEEVSQLERQALLAQVVMPFLEALQTGNVRQLEQLIGGKLALTLGKLLRENPEYPSYLRQRYGGTTVREAIQIEHHHDDMGGALTGVRGPRMALVQLQMPSGGQDHFLLILEQDTQAAWKIVDKIRRP